MLLTPSGKLAMGKKFLAVDKCQPGARLAADHNDLKNPVLLIAAILAMFGSVYSRIAFAVNECGVIASPTAPATIHCDGPTYSQTIEYRPQTDLNLIVAPDVAITPPTDTFGIAVWGPDAGNPAVNIDVNVEAATITTNGISGDGIVVQQGTSGDLSITTSGVNITTSHGTSPDDATSTGITGAIDTADATGDISINVMGGNITTTGDTSYGVYAVHFGQGDAKIVTSSTILTKGYNTDGTDSVIFNNASTGTASITQTGGTITTEGEISSGLYAISLGTGNVSAAAAGTIITSGAGSSGISVRSNNGADTSRATVDVGSTALIRTSGSDAAGIFASSKNTSLSVVEVITQGDIQTTGTGSHGIYGEALTIGNTNSVRLVQDVGGNIETTGDNSQGMYAKHDGEGSIDMENAAAISTKGANANGINAVMTKTDNTASISVMLQSGAISTEGDGSSGVSLVNQGMGLTIVNGIGGATIDTYGVQSHGIASQSRAGGVDFQLESITISTQGAEAIGILVSPIIAGAPTSAAVTSGKITTRGDAAHGIVVGAINEGADTTVFDTTNVNIKGSVTTSGPNSLGLVAVAANSTTVNVNADVTATGRFGAGMLASSTSGSTNIVVAQGATVFGGWQELSNGSSTQRFDTPSAGVVLGGTTTFLTNRGNIGALSDRAIAASGIFAPVDGDVTIDNYGTITGYLSLTGTGSNTFNNYSPNSFVMRHFADADGDGIRDTKRVAISDFGGPNSVFNNTVAGAVRFADVTNAAFTDDSGFYQPKTGISEQILDPVFYDLHRNGVVQSQLVNLSTFNHAGVIDLRGPAVGNTLVITDISDPNSGVGTSTFVSDGGRLLLNARLGAGPASGGTTGSEADMLIVDRTQRGSGATQVYVSQAPGSLGAPTVANGIQLVEVRDATHSADSVFVLGQRVAGGAYEYELRKGGSGLDATDGNWYLRSVIEKDPTTPSSPAIPNYRPEVPINMALPALGTRLGLSMLGTYHDRQGQDSLVSFGADAGGLGPKASWGRIIGEHGSARPGGGNIEQFEKYGPAYKFNYGGFQVGVDTYRGQSNNGKNSDQAGLYLGVGYINASISDFRGHRAGSATMAGYSVGAYWTRIVNSGSYLDTVGQFTYYGEATTRSRLGESSKTNGWGFIASTEGGHAFSLGSNWTLEPQAQVLLQHMDLRDTADTFGKIQFGDTTNVSGRLGARSTKQWQSRSGRLITTWARANIWQTFGSRANTTFSNLNGENPVALHTALGGTVGQAGVGISGEIAKNAYIFVTANYSHALVRNNGNSIAGQAGIKYRW
ncbi:outer membrane autotransporter barrel domain-containing protein [Nitrosospira sp. Nsp11]|nr:outer membrane autotransporter barrel domain-containing protein [Nitrosospira sp. Nsp11]